MSASKTVPDSRRWWKKKADVRGIIIGHLEAKLEALQAELEQVHAARATCTCQSKEPGHGN